MSKKLKISVYAKSTSKTQNFEKYLHYFKIHFLLMLMAAFSSVDIRQPFSSRPLGDTFCVGQIKSAHKSLASTKFCSKLLGRQNLTVGGGGWGLGGREVINVTSITLIIETDMLNHSDIKKLHHFIKITLYLLIL